MKQTETGVVFKESDYSSLLTRASIILIDLALLILLFVVGYFIDDYLYQNYLIDSYVITRYISPILAFLYLTILKTSKIGTLGQKITKTKILHINGKKPNIFVMTYRLFFWGFGPLNFITDFAWVTLNKEKRTVRDSLSNTITIKRNAEPISTDSEKKNIRVLFFGLNFLYSTAENETAVG